jgi:hypothetical protein
LDENLTKYVFNANQNGREFNVDIIAGHLMFMKPQYIESPAVHLVCCPGDSGYLSWNEGFYSKIIGDMAVGDLMILSNAALPTNKENEDIMGIQSVLDAPIGLLLPAIWPSGMSRGIPYVWSGFKVYQKTEHVKPELLNEFWFAINQVECYNAIWKEPIVVRRC